MSSDILTALKNRRSCYSITAKSPIADVEIKKIVDFAVQYTPSAFNSQSARVVLLLGAQHHKLWDIVRETLRKLVGSEAFPATADKIASFAAGYGTILFFEDQDTIRSLQEQYPTYKDAFPVFSDHSAGMLQLVVWTLLRDSGLGASLQHYGNLIQDEVAVAWGLEKSWKLIAQMPFGIPAAAEEPRDFPPLAKHVMVFS